jgi:hypothetical protein
MPGGSRPFILPKFGELDVQEIDTPKVNTWLEEVSGETPVHAKHHPTKQ